MNNGVITQLKACKLSFRRSDATEKSCYQQRPFRVCSEIPRCARDDRMSRQHFGADSAWEDQDAAPFPFSLGEESTSESTPPLVSGPAVGCDPPSASLENRNSCARRT